MLLYYECQVFLTSMESLTSGLALAEDGTLHLQLCKAEKVFSFLLILGVQVIDICT